jgi:hypothetical protein
MKQYRQILVVLVMLAFGLAGCAASRLDGAKQQYVLAMQAENPLPHYKAAIEELDATLARDPNFYQAYALKGLIYRNLEDFENASKFLKLAESGSYEGNLQWVPAIMNLTYGDIFHRQAGDSLRSGDWERAKTDQETAFQFFNKVIELTYNNLDDASADNALGVSMRDLYVKAQARWAAGKFQMAAIVGRENKDLQSETLREAVVRLNAVIESYPEETSLRYYLAEGYRKQALTIQKSSPEEGARLQERALAQLRVCGELGVPADLRNPAAQLVRQITQGEGSDVEMKILGSSSVQY